MAAATCRPAAGNECAGQRTCSTGALPPRARRSSRSAKTPRAPAKNPWQIPRRRATGASRPVGCCCCLRATWSTCRGQQLASHHHRVPARPRPDAPPRPRPVALVQQALNCSAVGVTARLERARLRPRLSSTMASDDPDQLQGKPPRRRDPGDPGDELTVRHSKGDTTAPDGHPVAARTSVEPALQRRAGLSPRPRAIATSARIPSRRRTARSTSSPRPSPRCAGPCTSSARSPAGRA